MNKFIDLKIKYQLIVLVIAALFQMIFIQTFLFLSFNSVLEKNAHDTLDIILYQIENNFNYFVAEIKSNNSKFTTAVEISPFIQAYYDAKNVEEKKSVKSYLLDSMNSDYFSSDNIAGSAIILHDGTELLSDYLVDNPEIYTQLHKEYILNADNNVRFNKSFFTQHFKNKKTDKSYFAYISPIYNEQQNNHSPFALFISIYDITTLYDFLKIREDHQASILLIEKNDIIAFNNPNWSNQILTNDLAQITSLDSYNDFINYNNKKYYTQVRTLGINNWKIVSLIASRDIIKSSFFLIPISFAIFIVATFIILSVSSFITWSITTPVNTIIEQLQNIDKNDLKQRLYTPVNNEVGIITKHINTMLFEIEKMNSEVLNTQKKLFQMDIAKKQAELSFYQQQINPHFLFNTLECIRSMADVYGAEEIAKISNAMAKIFRYSVKEDSIVTVSKELDCVKEYCSIMSLRFPGRYSLITDIDEKLYEVPVIKMLLQPIVENAIKHGLKSKRKNGNISIKAYLMNDTNYCIEIVDNGKGINPIHLKELKHNLALSENSENIKGIGIMNINNRIQLAYGDDYGIDIDSKENYWTKVILKLPYIKV